jgi:hypothetical protein
MWIIWAILLWLAFSAGPPGSLCGHDHHPSSDNPLLDTWLLYVWVSLASIVGVGLLVGLLLALGAHPH